MDLVRSGVSDEENYEPVTVGADSDCFDDNLRPTSNFSNPFPEFDHICDFDNFLSTLFSTTSSSERLENDYLNENEIKLDSFDFEENENIENEEGNLNEKFVNLEFENEVKANFIPLGEKIKVANTPNFAITGADKKIETLNVCMMEVEESTVSNFHNVDKFKTVPQNNNPGPSKRKSQHTYRKEGNEHEVLKKVNNSGKITKRRQRPKKPKLHEQDPEMNPQAKAAVLAKMSRDKKKAEEKAKDEKLRQFGVIFQRFKEFYTGRFGAEVWKQGLDYAVMDMDLDF